MHGLKCRSIQFFFIAVVTVWFMGCSALRPAVPDRDADGVADLSGILVVECIVDSEGRVCALDLPPESQVRVVTADCEGNCLAPSLSSSGQKIIFTQVSSAGTDIWQIDAAGRALRPLIQGETIDRNPVWSPDASWIAYRVLEDPYTLDTPSGHTLQAYRHSSLHVARPDGTDEGRLTSREGYVYAFDWAPDGNQIVISVRLEDVNQDGIMDRKDRVRLYTVNLATRDVRSVLNDVNPGLSMHEPSWSPDGDHIAYIEGHGDTTSYGDLVVVRANDSSEVARLDISPGAAYSWSPDGKKIAYVGYPDTVSRVGYVDMFVFNLSTQNETRLTDTSLYTVFGSYEFNGIILDDPVWSPDGGYLAFVWKKGGKSYVVVASADGSWLSRLVELGTGYYHLSTWGR
ncbi:MAG: hypothetical protein K8R89_01080 [Anaerolineae bacterium]|nr:hypothetical protein [Anaerolineae bacterium]